MENDNATDLGDRPGLWKRVEETRLEVRQASETGAVPQPLRARCAALLADLSPVGRDARPAVPILVEWLKTFTSYDSPDPDLAVAILSVFKNGAARDEDEEVVAELLRLMQDYESDQCQEAAVKALAAIGGSRVAAHLLDRLLSFHNEDNLEDSDYGDVVRILQQIGPPAVPLLRGALEDHRDNVAVQRAVRRILVTFLTPEEKELMKQGAAICFAQDPASPAEMSREDLEWAKQETTENFDAQKFIEFKDHLIRIAREYQARARPTPP